MGEMHSLLKRQLKRQFGDAFDIPPEWRAFIDRVDNAYHEFDADREMLEHSLELSSQELLDANTEMRAVFEAIPDVVLRANREGTILDIKSGAPGDLMLKRQDLIGKRLQDVPLADVARQYSEAIAQAVAQGTPVNFEYAAVLHGQESQYEARLVPLPEMQLAVIVRNITERKQSLRLLASAVEQTNESIVIADGNLDGPGARYLFVNPAFTRMTGYSVAEAVGQTPLLLRGPKTDRAEWLRMRETLRKGESYSGETIAYRKDGTEFRMEREVVPLRDSAGAVTHFLGMQRDVTERRRAQEELRLKTAVLEAQVNSSLDGIIVVDPQGRKTLQNGRTAELFKIPDSIALDNNDARQVKWVTAMTANPQQFVDKVAYLYSHPNEISRDEIALKDGTILDRYSSPVIGSGGECYGRIWTFRDITARHQVENALRESNEKFLLLAENITDVFWIRSADMREVLYVSPAFERIWGRSTASQYARPQQWAETIVPEDRERVLAAFATLMAAAPSLSIEYRIARPDGEIRWLHTRGFQVRDASGTLVRLTGVITDITERKLTEQALRQSEERFRLLNDLAEATRTLSDAEQIMAVTARMLGQRLQASRCAYADVQQDGEQFTIVHDYTDGCASTVGSYQLSLFGARAVAKLQDGQTLVIRDVDTELSPDDGADMFNAIGIKAIITCPLIKEGSLRAMMAVHQATPRAWTPGEVALVQDVVERCWAAIERRAAQERLRESKRFAESIAQNSTSLIYVIDLETGRNVYSNRNIAQRLGYSQEQILELGDTPLQRLIHPDDMERVARHIAQFAGVTDSRVIDLEYRLLHANGEWRWIWARDTVFERRPDGGGCQVMGTAQDITDRKHAEADLAAAHKELVETSRQAGMAEIATNVLHNVGNILNSVNVSAALVSSMLRNSRSGNLARAFELLDEHSADLGDFLALDPKGKLLPAYLGRLAQALTKERAGMMGELAHLTRSVEHIKDVVATQQSFAGAARVIEPVRICDLAEDALRMNGDALASLGVIVLREFATVPVVRLDRARVLQILVNLISNARHAMESGPCRSRQMTLRVEAVAGSCLRVSVRDEGEGIPPENLTRIFAHGFTTRKAGHGFGLHSSALAAQQMGGTLTVHSDGAGHGATFTLELPIGAAEATT